MFDGRHGQDIRKTIVTIARSELGVVEDVAPNIDSRERILQYWSEVNDGRISLIKRAGHPWCAAFVSWVYAMAGKPLNHKYGAGFSYVPYLWEHLKAMDYALYNSSEAQPGDLIVYMGKERPVHVGILERVEKYRFVSIEGNFSNGVNRRQIGKTHESILGFGSVFRMR